MNKAAKFSILIIVISLLSLGLSGQTFPNPATLSTGQGTPGNLDPLWTVTDVYPTLPPNPMGLVYTPALINNNCAPGSWVNPASLPPPVNNGNWITNASTPCATNTTDGYNYFRLVLDLPATCNGNGVNTVGSYVLNFSGYVDNTITDVFVNGISMGISGGAFAAGTQLNFTLPGPWAPGLNYIDVLVYNFPNGGQANPYGLLLVPNSTASAIDSDNDGVADINDLCPCVPGNNPNGCPPLISGDTIICAGETTSLRTFLAGDYLWSTGATIDSIIVSPTTNTAYSLTVTELSGTVHTATVNVTVNPAPVAAISPAVAAICTGDNITLTASGGSAYVWDNSQTTAAITVSPTTTTPYTVTVTGANGCTATATRSVTVNPLPNAAISPAVAAVCIDDNVTLTASGGTNYLWSNSQTNASVTVSPIVNTTYTVTVTDANGCSATADRNVTVNPLPVAAISPAIAVICLGESITLTASGATGFLWSNGATTASIVVSPATNTTYTVTVTDANGCSATASRSVTVNPLPVAAISPAVATICTGDDITLTASGGTGYLWSNSQTSAAITVSPTTNTTYTVTVTDANGCSASETRSVTVNPLPNAAVSPAVASICMGDNITLTASGGTNYLWSNSQTTASITESPIINTTYTVTVTDANGCSATADREVTVKPLPTATVYDSICSGDTYTLPDGAPATTTGTYTSTVAGPDCDTVITTHLTVNNHSQLAVAAAICQNQLYTLPSGNTVNTAGIYVDTLVNQFGCDSIIETTLAVNPVYQDTIVASICSPGTYTLPDGAVVSQQGIYTTSLTSSLGCDSVLVTDLTVLPTMSAVVNDTICAYQSYTLPSGRVVGSSGTFQDTIPASNSCDSLITVNLLVIDLTLSITADSVLCHGDATGTIAATDNGGINPINYQWSEPSFTGNNIGAAYAGVYNTTVTDAFGCTATSTVEVLQPAALSLVAQATDVSCFGEEDGSIAMAVQGGTQDYTMTMNGAPINSNMDNVTAGMYLVNCTDAHGCSIGDTLMVAEPDSFVLYAQPDSFTIVLGDTLAIDVSANYDPATQYVWDFNKGLSCMDCPNPILTTYDTDTLRLTATYLSTTQNVNCVNLFSLPVVVIEKKDLFIPTAFSPNNDGQNDAYQAYGNLKGLRVFNLTVFNRWGGVVFQTNDPHFVWDGTTKGDLVSGGVYVYVVRYAWYSSWETMNTEKGSLTIIR